MSSITDTHTDGQAGGRTAGRRRYPKSGRSILPYVLMSPAVIVTLLIVFLPMAEAIFLSLHDYVVWRPADRVFIGLGNFVEALGDEVFWISTWNTVLWIGITIPAQALLGLITAILLNRDFAWRGLARALVIIPWALPSVVIALMWRWIYDGNYGVLNDILMRVGILQSAFPWLANPDTALYSIILTLTWQGFPFFAVMILAGLQSIPKSYYEAAAIDGATAWQQFRYITMPGIAGVLATAILLRTIWVANSIDVIYVMTGGGPGYATRTLPLYAFITARSELDFGYGSALAVIFTIMLAGLILIYLRRVNRDMD
ncbi:sugar ABC transporter permease [Fodinicurvata sp. EGI_FJ10296]|uniref:carbohydrate ABC transporter permease n=1 Tax=Fodinicurvata sp. EGI_FJ10296 TaxID=3231908 RepID=UPI003452B4D8